MAFWKKWASRRLFFHDDRWSVQRGDHRCALRVGWRDSLRIFPRVASWVAERISHWLALGVARLAYRWAILWDTHRPILRTKRLCTTLCPPLLALAREMHDRSLAVHCLP